MEHYKVSDYSQAKTLFEQAASEGSREAKYRLGEFYEKGLGVDQNLTAAMRFYKEASEFYHDESNASSAEDQLLVQQKVSDEERRMHRFIMGKIDKTDTHAKSFIERYLSSDFGLYAYKPNYFLPYAYASSKYHRWRSTGLLAGDETYEQNYEAEFQISVKKPLSFDLLGLNEAIVFAYTQKVWWQIYSASAPFRETNYQPEVFITFPSADEFDRISGLKGLRLGLVHESNGRAGLQSRSWNRIYLGSLWQHGNLFSYLRIWYRIPEDAKRFPNDTEGDDNPDIEKYLGYGDLTLSYLYNQHHFGLMLRNNFHINGENRGAIALDWSHPMPYTEDTFWYIKLFSGYGESLIDYNRHVNKLSIGLSFSRGLF
ncbi:MAG: phospholipase A [Sulfurimonadaceae bacterium]|nr:phospholipase A [Sulfurimonadaceae bacterium]